MEIKDLFEMWDKDDAGVVERAGETPDDEDPDAEGDGNFSWKFAKRKRKLEKLMDDFDRLVFQQDKTEHYYEDLKSRADMNDQAMQKFYQEIGKVYKDRPSTVGEKFFNNVKARMRATLNAEDQQGADLTDPVIRTGALAMAIKAARQQVIRSPELFGRLRGMKLAAGVESPDRKAALAGVASMAFAAAGWARYEVEAIEAGLNFMYKTEAGGVDPKQHFRQHAEKDVEALTRPNRAENQDWMNHRHKLTLTQEAQIRQRHLVKHSMEKATAGMEVEREALKERIAEQMHLLYRTYRQIDRSDPNFDLVHHETYHFIAHLRDSLHITPYDLAKIHRARRDMRKTRDFAENSMVKEHLLQQSGRSNDMH